MVSIKTNLDALRESARTERFETDSGLSATTVQGAIEELASDVAVSAIEFVIDGGGGVISTGQAGFVEVPFTCTITRVTLTADQSGSCVIDIWKVPFASFPPTSGNSITASAKPTLSGGQSYQDSTLTGWTKTLTAGDILAYNVNSSNLITRVTISLRVSRTL